MVSMQVVFVVVIDRFRGELTPRSVIGGISLAIVGVLVITGVDFSLSPQEMEAVFALSRTDGRIVSPVHLAPEWD